MKILKNTFLVSIMMMAILLCCSSQLQASQDGDYMYTITDGEAEITGYSGVGGDVTIPSTLGGAPVTSIGSAFSLCTDLISINIPDGVTSIGYGAFESCYGLRSINISQGVTSIDDNALVDCPSLTTITVAVNNLNYSSINGMLCNKAGTILIKCPEGVSNIIIPQEVTSIGGGAFWWCSRITSINIPERVTSIGPWAFGYCEGLKSIRLNSATTTIHDRDDTIPATTKIIGYDQSTANTYAVNYGRTFEAIPVTLQSIGVTTPVSKLIYTVGDTLNISGLVVTGTYTINGTTNIVPITIENITIANITGFDSSTPVENQVLTISVGGKTTTYKVQILAAPPDDGDFTYNVTNGTAQITGYTGAGGVVTIPNTLGGVPVTSIGNNAFEDCTSITSISIPEVVTSIGGWTFSNCYGLTSISIPQGVTSIGDNAFSGCYSLTSISIPEGVTSIGNFIFFRCTGLMSISIPQGVTSIGDYAFSDCTRLTIISLPQKLISIGDWAFSGCYSLTSINIPQGVTDIGNVTFYNCTGLTSISISQGVTSIGDAAFSGCTGLTSISIPQGVTSIGDYAFSDCTGLTTITVAVDNLNYVGIDGVLFNKARTSLIACPGGLTTINIPEGVTTLGVGAFYGCTGLTTISIPQGVISIGTSTFHGCKTLTSINIPQGVTSISNWTFQDCRGLTTISIPQGVTSIGDYAFYGCTGLTTITFNSSTTEIYDTSDTIPATTKIIGYDSSTAKDYATKYFRTFDVISTTDTLQSIAITTPATKLIYSIGHQLDITGLVITGTYSDGSTKSESITAGNVTGFDSSLAIDQVLTITVGEKTTTYEVHIVGAQNEDFRYTVTDGKAQITGYTGAGGVVAIPGRLGGFPVTSIGDWAFNNCDILTGISLPEGVTSIGSSAFSGCVGLTTINISQGVKTIGDFAFNGCTGLTIISLPQGVTTIGFASFDNCIGLTSINIQQGVTSIGGWAFAWCTGLTSMSIPQGVTCIGEMAFYMCTSLTSINIPQGVTSIGEGALLHCASLNIITVADDNLNFKSIDGVLYNKAGSILIACPISKTNIVIPHGVTNIGNYAFEGCRGLTSIRLHEGVTSIGRESFQACEGLTSISLPQGVTSIDASAFSSCTGLTSIIIPDSVISIGVEAFFQCMGLSVINIPKGVINIGNKAFSNCRALTSITVADDNLDYASVDGALFNKDGTILVEWPGGLNTISIPKGVTSIGDYAFSNIHHATTILIPKEVTSIGEGAFTFSGITSINIPQEVLSIGKGAFSNCYALTSIGFNSAETTIYDDENTIPASTKIIGFDPSTAKDYAAKYNRTFEVIGYTATPLVQIGINPDYGDSAGIFVGLKDIKNTLGNLVPDAKLAGYQIDVNYDHNQVKVFDMVDEGHLGNFLKVLNPDKASVADAISEGTSNFDKLFFVPLAITGSSTDTTSVTIKFTSLSDAKWNDIIIPDVTLTFQRGKIASEASQKPLRIVDAVAGLQYLANIVDAGLDPGKVNVVNMASIIEPEAEATCIKPSVKDVITLMQYLVNMRDPYFNLIDGGGEPTPPETAGFHLTDVVYYNDVIGRGMLELEGVNGNAEEKLYSLRVDTLETVTGSSGIKYEVSENYSTTFPTKIDKFAISSVTPGNVRIVALDESGREIGDTIANLETEAQDNDLIELVINEEGAITGLSFLAKQTFSETTNALELDDNYINGYMLNSNTVVFDGSKGYTTTYNPDPEDIVVTTWGSLADKGFIVVKASYYVDSDNEVDYLVIKESVAASITDYNAVVTKVLLNTDGEIVRMYVFLDGIKKTYDVNELINSAVVKGSVVTLSFIDDSGVVEGIVVTGKQGLVTDVNVANRTVTIDSDIDANDGTYRLVADASVINSKDPSDILVNYIGDIAVGDTVTLSLDEEVPATSYFIDVVNIQSSAAQPSY